MKFEIQRNPGGFVLIDISYNRNVWGSAYNKYFCIWICNIGFVWKWRGFPLSDDEKVR